MRPLTLTPTAAAASLCAALSLGLAASLAAPAFAQAPAPSSLGVPNAGQVLKELQSNTPGLAPSAAPGPANASGISGTPSPAPAAAKPGVSAGAAAGPQVVVRSFVFEGHTQEPGATLQALLAPLIGQSLTLAQLEQAAARISAHYRAQGYPLARAYLPAQDITSGRVTIAVLEGRLQGRSVRNASRLSDAQIAAYLGPEPTGQALQSQELARIERQLQVLQETPGVGSARADLQPGTQPGTTALRVDVGAAPAMQTGLTLDNHGSRYTGQTRLGASFNWASPLGRGDQLSAQVLSSGSLLQVGQLAYQAPVGYQGLRVGLNYAHTQYKLGREFAALQAHGSASTTSAFASYPLVRQPGLKLTAQLVHERKDLSDRVDATATRTDKALRSTSLGLGASSYDGFGGGGQTQAEISWGQGRLNILSASARTLDAASAKTQGRFERLTYSASRLQRLGAGPGASPWQLLAQVQGQKADKNLDSAEKFSLGGPAGVRAFASGEGSGDEGHKASVELRYALGAKWLGANWRMSAFYDWGHVRINRVAFDPTAVHARSLAGGGLGLQADVQGFELKASLAWRTQGDNTAVPASAAKGPTLWLGLRAGF